MTTVQRRRIAGLAGVSAVLIAGATWVAVVDGPGSQEWCRTQHPVADVGGGRQQWDRAQQPAVLADLGGGTQEWNRMQHPATVAASSGGGSAEWD